MTDQAATARPAVLVPTSKWLRREPDPRARGRVFCIPPAGSGTSVFDGWPAQLDGVDLLPIELPGRLSRFTDAVPDSYGALAAALIQALTPWLDRPFGFFGHCWSAIAAFEVTVQLEQQGRPPAHLFVSSEAPPHWGPYGRMLEHTDEELDHEIIATVEAMGKTPHPELIALYRTVLRHDIELRRRYPPTQVVVATPITAYAWSDDAEYDQHHLAAWERCGTIDVVTFPGAHNAFTDAPPPLLRSIVSTLPAR